MSVLVTGLCNVFVFIHKLAVFENTVFRPWLWAARELIKHYLVWATFNFGFRHPECAIKFIRMNVWDYII